MLLVVVALLLAAGGVLVTAVVADQVRWAWGSVLLSVLAGALLLLERLRRRRASRATGSGGAEPVPVDEPAEVDRPEFEAASVSEAGAEPDEEDTDAADLLVVSELETPVIVLDERPRYHLEDCRRLGEDAPVSLPLREARELGFTPCALCAPDAVTAARERHPHRCGRR